MQLVVGPTGTVRCLYGETIDLLSLGHVSIRRGSHVEPAPDGRWSADLAPTDGPRLGPFEHRSSALAAEQAWLKTHWLTVLSQPG